MDKNSISIASLLFFLFAMVAAPANAGKKEANISAFADQTIALLSNPNYGFSIDETILIRKYINADEPAYEALLSSSERILQLLISMTNYSIEIATLSSINNSEAEQVTAYADYLDTLQENIVTLLGIPNENFSDLITNIRRQESLLDAIRTGQPIINAFGRYAQLLLNDYDELVSTFSQQLDTAIEQDYATLIDFKAKLDQRRVVALTEIANMEGGDTSIQGNQKGLAARLDRMQETAAIVLPQIELYWDTHRELDAIHFATQESSTQVRWMILLWGRAHAAMARGRSTSTDWVAEYKDLATAAYKFGRKAYE